jgi:type IV pilus assembly protein PilA
MRLVRHFDDAMNKPSNFKSGSGFSLVELLVVIAVIAIIAAIAIPNIANITQSADAATKLRNAQTLASTYNNYAEAFYAQSNAYPSTSTVPAAIAAMEGGQTVINTRLGTTNVFRVPGITVTNTATNKLTFTNNQLVYDPD